MRQASHSWKWISKYTYWLHTQWPAGTVEPLPIVRENFTTQVPGLYVVGDLAGVPLLKFSADTGARALQHILMDPTFASRDRSDKQVLDVAIIGGGVSGFSAALEARKAKLTLEIYEAAEPFNTIVNFPRAKPIYTYPTDMTPSGSLQFHAKSDVKEGLLEDLREQTLFLGIEPTYAKVDKVQRVGKLLHVILEDGQTVKAHRVIVAIGRSGQHRKLNVPGEELPKVYNRLHDPKDFHGCDAMVVGGGDSAVETAIALADAGANVTMTYRKATLSRPKPDNIDELEKRVEAGLVHFEPSSKLCAIHKRSVDFERSDGSVKQSPNDVVFSMIGREAPLDFFRRSGVPIHGERNTRWWVTLVAFLALCVFIYHWKKPHVTILNIPPFSWIAQIGDVFAQNDWFPYNVPSWLASTSVWFENPAHLLGTMRISLGEPGFYYSFIYCSLVVLFGIDRIRRRKTPYITVQTVTLALIQCIPLFILPYILLPWLGHNGLFAQGTWLGGVIDTFFPTADYTEHGREYWRAFGLILAWPLFIWNVFTHQPLWGWLILSVIQTFVIIPGIIYFWGKGAYCGWICSCGALAETLGDRHRQKMPHGPFWNRANMLGQVFLVFALVLLVFRSLGWAMGHDSWPAQAFDVLMYSIPLVNYVWFVDLLWAGILGVGLYFWFSGRVWCRFACPLAALMHIYARFSQFRILADKKKCISCNVCTSVCHQGIDIMNFANKGLPMEDPQCVRCSACVQSCPTGVLSFGRVDRNGQVIAKDPDWLIASPVQCAELTIQGKSLAK